MTLNELIEWARENDVDFDALVFVPHAGAVDIERLETSFRAGSGTSGLVIRIF